MVDDIDMKENIFVVVNDVEKYEKVDLMFDD